MDGIKLVWDIAVAFFQMTWENIKAIFSVVSDVLSGDFSGAWEGIKQIFANVGEFFLKRLGKNQGGISNEGGVLAKISHCGRLMIKSNGLKAKSGALLTKSKVGSQAKKALTNIHQSGKKEKHF